MKLPNSRHPLIEGLGVISTARVSDEGQGVSVQIVSYVDATPANLGPER